MEDVFRVRGPEVALPELDVLRAPEEDLEAEFERAVGPSAWDPEPVDAVLSAENVRTLLTNVIRRAAHDWVLYRTSSRMDQRELAAFAYTWLFEEDETHPWFLIRKCEGKELTSFLSICEIIDVDPDFAREKIRALTPRDVKMAGRPAERRYRQSQDTTYYQEMSVEDVVSYEYYS